MQGELDAEMVSAAQTTLEQVNDGLSTAAVLNSGIKLLRYGSRFIYGAGLVTDIILSFVPNESDELAYMKEQFQQVNMKLDRIESNVERVIETFKNFKAEYKSQLEQQPFQEAERKIKHASEKMQQYEAEIAQVACASPEECLKNRIEIARRFIHYFDIDEYLQLILRDSVEGGVFYKPLIDILFTSDPRYKCNLTTFHEFEQGVIGLALKAQQIILVYEKLTGSNHSIKHSVQKWIQRAGQFVHAMRSLHLHCMTSVDQVASDIQLDLELACQKSCDKYTNNTIPMFYSYDLCRNFTQHIYDHLQSRYNTRIDSWLLITLLYSSHESIVNSDVAKIFVTRKCPQRIMAIAHDRYEAHSYVARSKERYIRIMHRHNKKIKKNRSNVSNPAQNMKRALKKANLYDDRISVILVLDDRKFNSYEYPHANPTAPHAFSSRKWIFTYRHIEGSLYIPRRRNPVLTLFKAIPEMHNRTCNKYCNHPKGICVFLPFTRKNMACKCNPLYYGDDCSHYFMDAPEVTQLLASSYVDPKNQIPDIYLT